MPLSTFTLPQLTAILATAYASQAVLPANTDAGSTLGSVFNADALLALNVQQQAIYVDAISRLATCQTIDDASSFGEPFGITPLSAQPSSGQVTASTPSAVTVQIVVPVGGIFTTTTGLQFSIIADTTNAAYGATLNGYPINAGQSSVNCSVLCLTAGTIGNVAAGTITQIYNGTGLPVISGITAVSNASAFSNATDTETLVQYQTRFTALMSTGNVSTGNALAAAVLSVQPGLTYSIGDGVNSAGVTTAATVSIYVNVAGTGTAPATSLITKTQAALNLVRSAGITVTAYAPATSAVNVAATIHCPVGTNTTGLAASLTSTYNAYVNGIGLNPTGGTTEVDLFTIAAILRISGVTKIDSLTLNAGTADITAAFGTVLVAGSSSWTFALP